ncbi:MAG TPA: Wzz/FepE/Etk N-terminal domain-containing protein [Thermoleophilaceae bacterium]|nr:Wzz/FepE/Etk N-terminal domain-containing protein [Thermoleophilaceae bacterium]
MKDRPRYATVRDYVRVLRQQRLLIAIVAFLFASTTFAISNNRAKTYTAEAAMQFSEPTQAYDLIGQPIGSRQTPDQLAAAGAELVKQQRVARAVRRALKLKVSSSALLALVSAQPEARTDFVIVSAHSESPEFSAQLANEFAGQAERITDKAAKARFKRAADTIRNQLKRLPNDPQNALSRSLARERLVRLESVIDVVDTAHIVKRAEVPTSATSPKPARDAFVGLLVGLTLAIIAAFIRDALDERVRGTGDMGFEPLPVLGHVSNAVMGRARFLTNGKRRSVAPVFLEHFQILRRNVEFLDPKAPPRTVLVTSPLAEEGKSTVASSLAWASVVTGRNTLLVECDLRRPSLARKLDIAPSPGLAEYLLGDVEPENILQTVDVQAAPLGGNGAGAPAGARSLVCITGGRLRASSPPELFDSARFRQFLEQVSGVYELVVLDCAPLLPVADTLELVPQVDAVLLCLRAFHTTREQVRSAKVALERFPTHPTGVVLTDVRPGDAKSFGYYAYDYSPASTQ